MQLTLEQLKQMEPGIFLSGTAIDSPLGVNMTNSGRMLRWVAVRGGIYDWAIYCHWDIHSEEYIRRSGDKIFNKETIRRLVPCTDEAFLMYRF